MKLRNAINATGFALRQRTLNDASHFHALAQCIQKQWKIKYCQHSIEFARLSNPIEFDHRFLCDCMCVCVGLCLVFVYEFTFQFKINRNFMSFIHFVWTSTERIFLCFVFDCHFSSFFSLVSLFGVFFCRWRCRSIYFDGYLNWCMNFWCRRRWMISVQHTVYTR